MILVGLFLVVTQTANAGTMHRVEHGDSWQVIAQKYYGDSSRWEEIVVHQANRSKVTKRNGNVKRPIPGQVVFIPTEKRVVKVEKTPSSLQHSLKKVTSARQAVENTSKKPAKRSEQRPSSLELLRNSLKKNLAHIEKPSAPAKEQGAHRKPTPSSLDLLRTSLGRRAPTAKAPLPTPNQTLRQNIATTQQKPQSTPRQSSRESTVATQTKPPVDDDWYRKPHLPSVAYARDAVATKPITLYLEEMSRYTADKKYIRVMAIPWIKGASISKGEKVRILARSSDSEWYWFRVHDHSGNEYFVWASAGGFSVHYTAADQKGFCAKGAFSAPTKKIGLWRARVAQRAKKSSDPRCAQSTPIPPGALLAYGGMSTGRVRFMRFLMGSEQKEVFLPRNDAFERNNEFITGLPNNLNDAETKEFLRLRFSKEFRGETLEKVYLFKSPDGSYKGNTGWVGKGTEIPVHTVLNDLALVSAQWSDGRHYGWIRANQVISIDEKEGLISANNILKWVLILAAVIYFPLMLFTQKGQYFICAFGHFVFDDNAPWKNIFLALSFLGFMVAFWSVFSTDAWRSDKSGWLWWAMLAAPFFLLLPFFIYVSVLWIRGAITPATATVAVNTRMDSNGEREADHTGLTDVITGQGDDRDRTKWRANYEKKRAEAIRDALRAKKEAYEAQHAAALARHQAARSKVK